MYFWTHLSMHMASPSSSSGGKSWKSEPVESTTHPDWPPIQTSKLPAKLQISQRTSGPPIPSHCTLPSDSSCALSSPHAEFLVRIMLGKEEVLSKPVVISQFKIYDPEKDRSLGSRSNILIFVMGNHMYYCDLVEYSVTFPSR